MTAILRRYGGVLAMLAIFAFFVMSLPDTFPTARNLINITQQISMLAVVAATMTVVMVMGDFDLSVGAMASLAGVVAAALFVQGWPVPLAVVVALAVGLIGGFINGFMVSIVGILPFVATLATLTIFSGAAFIISDGRTIFGRDIPEAFSGFARSGLALGDVDGRGLVSPNLTLAALAVVALVWVVLEQTSYGRRLYAIGGNREAARWPASRS